MNKEYWCPKCGQHWVVHNDDGSCVIDDELDIYCQCPEDEVEPHPEYGDICVACGRPIRRS